jgi:hypothetical protein
VSPKRFGPSGTSWVRTCQPLGYASSPVSSSDGVGFSPVSWITILGALHHS